ncbi:kinase-like domain-containing protein [Suillus clintonianus]|uniref:kinase-like domain-containing protein n=1 Tax=Suillus clintonianus TaxID=1904413 RepID=UPI001B862AD4|nr:kinase-like domain-containing protein [Suillus clintonianus]KAG2145866.1 kinase-like domain-containing protein [Suillus clintonianus]
MAHNSDTFPRRMGNYWLQDRLGSGYSGSIFKAHHVHDGTLVALKVQDVNHECPTNRYEQSIYPLLQGGEGMPRLWANGIEGKWHYLVISLLGKSLESIYRQNLQAGHQTMDLRSVCSIAIQVIARLQIMHNREVLHRDIQLGNCAIGLTPEEETIYMIDFGFSKRFIDPHTRRHILDSKQKRDFLGNYWFTSVNVHCKGKVPSRRDDLEAAALMFIHLLTPGGLPWTRNGVPKTDSAHDRIKRAKKNSCPEDLCKGMPSEFEEFLRYCRRLKFHDCPDYDQWKDEFKALAQDSGFTDIERFIWPPPKASKVVRPAPTRPTIDADEMANVLNDLAKLQLNPPRPILGDQTNVPAPTRKDDAKKPGEIISVSDSSEDGRSKPNAQPLPPRTPVRTKKASQLQKLKLSVLDSTDNAELAIAVEEFAKFLQLGSKTLTKEGFAFLDALYKQLADPSIFVHPLRTLRSATQEDTRAPQPAHVKLGVVARLRREVGTASSNRVLANLVADFGAVTNKSSGRTITKDGFAFLEGLAARLQALN